MAISNGQTQAPESQACAPAWPRRHLAPAVKPSSTHLSRAAITSTAQVTGVMRGEAWLQNLHRGDAWLGLAMELAEPSAR